MTLGIRIRGGIPKKEDKRGWGHTKEGHKILKEIRKLREMTKRRKKKVVVFLDELKKENRN